MILNNVKDKGYKELSIKKSWTTPAPQNSLKCKWFKTMISNFHAAYFFNVFMDFFKWSKNITLSVCICSWINSLTFKHFIFFKDWEIKKPMGGRKLSLELQSKWTNTNSSIFVMISFCIKSRSNFKRLHFL